MAKLMSARSKALMEEAGMVPPDEEEQSEETEYLRGVLLDKGEGVIMKAWRKYFDPYCIGDVTFTKFCKGLTSLGAAGEDAVDLWKKLDSDGTNLLTLDEVDMDSFLMMEYCQRFCDKFGGAADMFAQVDYNRDGRLDREEFGLAMQSQGFCDDPDCPEFLNTPQKVSDRLFPVCDVNGDGSISMLELLFLERDVEKRKEVRDRILQETHEKKFGKPKSMLAHYMLRDITRATNTIDNYINFMDEYGGGNDEKGGGFKAEDLQLLVSNKKPAWYLKLKNQARGEDPWSSQLTGQLDDYWSMENQIALAKKESKIFAKKANKTKSLSPQMPQPVVDKEKIETRRYLKAMYQRAIARALVAREPNRSAVQTVVVAPPQPVRESAPPPVALYDAYKPSTKEMEAKLRKATSGDKKSAIKKPTDIMRSTDQLYTHYAKQ
ncbi:unnamed protein product [Amoebophrya sp. A120]|nr:unnamed protein product [Amoebophrya sp. A120]|eukprot:GSA120T00018942001.1